MQPAKPQISLRIRAVWSEPLLEYSMSIKLLTEHHLEFLGLTGGCTGSSESTLQSLCLSLEYSMSVKLLTEHHLEFLGLTGGCTGSSESTLVKIPHCWKSHAAAQLCWRLTTHDGHWVITKAHSEYYVLRWVKSFRIIFHHLFFHLRLLDPIFSENWRSYT